MLLGAAVSSRGFFPPVPVKAATTAAWALSNLCRSAGAAEVRRRPSQPPLPQLKCCCGFPSDAFCLRPRRGFPCLKSPLRSHLPHPPPLSAPLVLLIARHHICVGAGAPPPSRVAFLCGIGKSPRAICCSSGSSLGSTTAQPVWWSSFVSPFAPLPPPLLRAPLPARCPHLRTPSASPSFPPLLTPAPRKPPCYSAPLAQPLVPVLPPPSHPAPPCRKVLRTATSLPRLLGSSPTSPVVPSRSCTWLSTRTSCHLSSAVSSQPPARCPPRRPLQTSQKDTGGDDEPAHTRKNAAPPTSFLLTLGRPPPPASPRPLTTPGFCCPRPSSSGLRH